MRGLEFIGLFTARQLIDDRSSVALNIVMHERPPRKPFLVHVDSRYFAFKRQLFTLICYVVRLAAAATVVGG